MMNFISEHKKISIVSAIILGCLLVSAYLYALFLPGLWHNGAFLYKKADGRFVGSDEYAEYVMIMAKNKNETDISFKVNETQKEYKVVKQENTTGVQIFENGESIFKGTVLSAGNLNLLENENGEIVDIVRIRVGGVTPEEAELFPNVTELYNISLGNTDTRGEPYMLILVIILAVVLAIDIAFPDLFFYFRHGLNVDGGTPSDYYRMGQTFGRVVCAIGIAVCIVMSFTVR